MSDNKNLTTIISGQAKAMQQPGASIQLRMSVAAAGSDTMSGLSNKNVLDAWKAYKNKKRTIFLKRFRSEFPELAGMSDDRISAFEQYCITAFSRGNR